MRILSSLGAAALVVALVACGSQKAPAEAALKAAEDAYGAVSAEAEMYVHDQAHAIDASLASAKAAFDKGDYATTLTQAQALPAQINALGPAISAKKAELTTSWHGMTATVPSLVNALKSRIDAFSRSKRLPAGITKGTLDKARLGLATVNQGWSDASSAAASGDLPAALSKAHEVKTTVIGLMKSLNMQVPAGAGN